MYDETIIFRMNDYLHKAAQALASWLSVMLPKSGNDWWQECVLDNLSYTQRELIQKNRYTKLEELDLTALLRVANKSWYTMRNYAYLPTSERECIRDMIEVRNNWAHISAELPGKDTIVSDITCLIRFFGQMNQHDLIAELERLREMVKLPDPFANEEPRKNSLHTDIALVNPSSAETRTNPSQNDAIEEKSLVYVVGRPETKGMVFSVSQLGDTKKYEVFVDGTLKTFYEGQIAPFDSTPAYEWVDSETLRSYLSAYQINNPSSGNLYSLNAARIDFVPYQFRPALKLIKADEPRILIADSVGVGKTIEAGLIIKELQARSDLENILIICPKPLVADRKWENEMKRFDEEFIPLDGEALRQIISDTDRDGRWPARYGKVIIPYSILDSRTYLGDQSRHHRSFGLEQLDPAPHFDLVIIDEAHHLRNGSMEKEKAFAYKCVHYFCENADAVVMLTATPLQTSNDDLYTLLHLLRPDVVIDKQNFAVMTRPNPYISQCAHIVRAAKDDWKGKALEALDHVLTTQWGENVISKNPVFAQIRSVLGQESVSREERVKLVSDIESLHSFSMMLNRTRRKDIQEFCIRRTHTLESEFTVPQRKLHDELLNFEAAALSRLHSGRGIKFMMSTIRRQAASCIFGLAPHIRDIIDRRFNQIVDDPENDFDMDEMKETDYVTLRSLAKDILDMANHLPNDDPKFDGVLQVIREKQKYANNKIILFSTFRYTLNYVRGKLLTAGFRVGQIDGSVNNDDRLELRARFELPKDDPQAIDIMLFTEVGSEGLDYQFCDMMINYDLPWNPMRIEQRIGRIDRRGQGSEVVNIYNVITEGTVDADIYDRCLSRIGVFEGSIGECEEILGEIGQQIEIIALDNSLTDAERKEKLEQMADNEVRRAQEMNRLENEEKELFGFDLSNYTVSREIRDAESPFLSARNLQHLVETYLSRRLGGSNYIMGESSLKTLRLSAEGRSVILKDLRNLTDIRSGLLREWEVYLKGNKPNHPITFDPETAANNRDTFFITPVHPLVKQAASYFATNKLVYIHLEYYSDEIAVGDYPISIYAWDYVGLRSSFRLVTICEEPQIAAELPEYILTATATNSPPPKLRPETWDRLEERHVKLWQAERAMHKENTLQTARYKLESLTNNYRNQKIVLERQINDSVESRIDAMRRSELDKITQRYHKRMAEIEADISKADIHTTLIANGILTVKGGNGSCKNSTSQ